MTTHLLTRREAAQYVGSTEGTLATWACTKAVQIPYLKIGRSVRYRRSDLDAWLATRVVNPLRTEG